ncbi:MAG: bifunctional 4-hydroxy-2-oxoglutarate aldolase/2-dehydro-3-deoxy-phosphogluconate aldolase [Fretibacterium sp.]|nr:bifunctional 4-hydroxy-2-oxoglutarate aldolase/2-dehydro-3-deoxy-phosphogluconate aldolase [Fretibacterium sp.]
MEVLDRIGACGIVPVVVLEEPGQAVPLARALLAGGIGVAEVTFRTSAAEESIRRITAEVPEILVGAGTILNPEQLGRAVDAGARFIVSPGIDPSSIKKASELNVPIFPGVVTPSEIMTGLSLGINIFKFFPAGNYGGLKTMKALWGPFPGIKFMPTGGVSPSNLPEYLADERVFGVGGSWMCPVKLVREGNYDEITRLSQEAVKLYDECRGSDSPR